ncbi:hypothetical protein N7468_006272 [Penicillium chermesinum]|uniref:DNA-directed RNA polymerase III subunit RPC6 n=1 Tax=Penicillium chermesinum TaxID=63820 RepID=A0A9W9TJE8_9EURO|nr:uncharacterized protein N7468_006272 [Penicillium chermesinum]KAJ5225047.1 hypothetical protein N7468_006272 [Penicillium chermesinum]
MASAGSVAELASQLYDACAEHPDSDRAWYQGALLDLNIIPKGPNEIELLLQCTQSLVDQKLFRLLETQNKRLAWRIVSREDAEKLSNLNPDESLVFSVIHSSARVGIWTRNIQTRTGLHKTIMDRCIKSLESKNYIKAVQNVKFPSRKMYMLAGLAPSEDVTGGAWFTDGALDSTFISSVADYLEYTISDKSWYKVPEHGRNKRVKTASGKADVKLESGEPSYLPHPPNYPDYPTVQELTNIVNSSGLTPVQLSEDKVLQLLNLLVFDHKITAMPDGNSYKALKNPQMVKQKKQGEPDLPHKPVKSLGENGMTEGPCGRCPSFRLCSPGAAISPETCEYFDPWMQNVLGF